MGENNLDALKKIMEENDWEVEKSERYLSSLESQLVNQKIHFKRLKEELESIDYGMVSSKDLKDPEKIKQILSSREKQKEEKKHKISLVEKELKRLETLIQREKKSIIDKKDYAKTLTYLLKLTSLMKQKESC